MRSELIVLVEEVPEGGYSAGALGEDIFTWADTLDELRAMVRDAVDVRYGDEERPRIIRLHIVRDEVLAG